METIIKTPPLKRVSVHNEIEDTKEPKKKAIEQSQIVQATNLDDVGPINPLIDLHLVCRDGMVHAERSIIARRVKFSARCSWKERRAL